MEAIFNTLLAFLLLYNYAGIFVISFLAAFLLPLPSSSLLAAAGAFFAQGYFTISYVLIAAFLGNILGDAAGYFIAEKMNTSFLEKIGFKKILTSKLYIRLSATTKTFSYSLIFFSRFVTAIGPLINIASGSMRFSKRHFFMIAAAGELAYVLLYGLTGYFLGSEWENNLSFLLEATFVIVTLGLIIVAIQYGVSKKINKRKIISLKATH